jgi:hypothetical protein
MTQNAEQVKEAMDKAAEVAAKTIPTTGSAKDLADWLAKNYMAAGYKRLCRVILQAFGHR